MTQHSSSTREIPKVSDVPKHVAIIMDGNGRWARKRFLPRVAGHKRGVETVREIIRACIQRGISYLTLFAFSSENWRRPADEVSFLMQLFLRALEDEIARLHENRIRFRVIGDLSRFDHKLTDLIHRAEALTAGHTRLTLTIAANYGGRWDILQAVNRLAQARPERAGHATEDDLAPFLALNFAPEPDLFIRTGGEQRISNFLLWQLAYTELHFTELLWPEFDSAA
ncbi:MAG: di-trans,poly-cis-decaprenylcistransferase, partial [Rhodocyclaceae bacterium]|nr:di-trans,poly-cis-decaprenylcistransferase [Rhodocyclaceae bacterium]